MPKKIILRLIRLYQKTSCFHGYIARVLFLTDAVCRFTPTCSQYTYEAVEKYGAVKGVFTGLRRVVRCHPWSAGGVDPLK
jgi:putative membrane protein insertion efficiency factor